MFRRSVIISMLYLLSTTQHASAEGLTSNVETISKLTETIAKGGLITLGLVLVLIVVPLGHKVHLQKWLLSSIIGLGVGSMGAGIWLVPRQLILAGTVRVINGGEQQQLLIRSDLLDNNASRIEAFQARRRISDNSTDFALISTDKASCLLIVAFKAGSPISGGEERFDFFRIPITFDDYGSERRLMLSLSYNGQETKLDIKRLAGQLDRSSATLNGHPVTTDIDIDTLDVSKCEG